MVWERGYQKVVVYHEAQLGGKSEEAEWDFGWGRTGGRTFRCLVGRVEEAERIEDEGDVDGGIADVSLRGGIGLGLYMGNQEGDLGEDGILLIGHRHGGCGMTFIRLWTHGKGGSCRVGEQDYRWDLKYVQYKRKNKKGKKKLLLD